MAPANSPRSDLEPLLARVIAKRDDYARYDFTRGQDDLLRTFFDLSQEFDSLRDFYRICVSVLLEFMALESRLYLLDSTGDHLELVCDSRQGLVREHRPVPDNIRLRCGAYEDGGSYIVPIHRKLSPSNDVPSRSVAELVMGMLEVYPGGALTKDDRFFLKKYSNRIGFNLQNRLIAQQNIKHLKFINNLVMDIEHNIIVPNMYFKHLFNQLKKRIKEMGELEKTMQDFKQTAGMKGAACEEMINRVVGLHENLIHCHQELLQHHASYSLSLESLFRRDHFKEGHFVLHPKACHVVKDIIKPQLDHFKSRLGARGIVIDHPRDMAEEEIPLMVDVGLLSQVYGNLFSNAVKYTEDIIGPDGKPRKAVAYGRDILPGCFGPGKDCVKFNVFTTGPHLFEEEVQAVFSDGFRGRRSHRLPGTGHGLAFVKQVIEIHGGIVGYEPTEGGNNFYFILPLPSRRRLLPEQA